MNYETSLCTPILCEGFDEAAIDESLEVIRFALGRDTVKPVWQQFGSDRFTIHVARHDDLAYTLVDHETDFVIKSHLTKTDALLQQRVMNALHTGLGRAESPVGAVRHFAVVSLGNVHAMSLIERAQGIPLRSGLSERYEDQAEVLKTITTETELVQHELDDALGRFVSRSLANDLLRRRNIGGNVYRSDMGYHLIDQPFLSFSGRSVYPQIQAALRLLEHRNR